MVSILFLTIFLFSFKTNAIKTETILVVLAHPDDETAFSLVLKKYSKTHKIYLLIATDGRFGQPKNAIPVDSLVEIEKMKPDVLVTYLAYRHPSF